MILELGIQRGKKSPWLKSSDSWQGWCTGVKYINNYGGMCSNPTQTLIHRWVYPINCIYQMCNAIKIKYTHMDVIYIIYMMLNIWGWNSHYPLLSIPDQQTQQLLLEAWCMYAFHDWRGTQLVCEACSMYTSYVQVPDIGMGGWLKETLPLVLRRVRSSKVTKANWDMPGEQRGRNQDKSA